MLSMLYVIVICVLYLLPLFLLNFINTVNLYDCFRVFNNKIRHFLNIIKIKLSSVMESINQSSDTSLKDSNQEYIESVYSLKMFQFERIRCKNLKTDNKNITINQNMNYEVPSKRSGHRAVCDDENLWTWGGYCPTSTGEEEVNPMLPEVCMMFKRFKS